MKDISILAENFIGNCFFQYSILFFLLVFLIFYLFWDEILGFCACFFWQVMESVEMVAIKGAYHFQENRRCHLGCSRGFNEHVAIYEPLD